MISACLGCEPHVEWRTITYFFFKGWTSDLCLLNENNKNQQQKIGPDLRCHVDRYAIREQNHNPVIFTVMKVTV